VHRFQQQVSKAHSARLFAAVIAFAPASAGAHEATWQGFRYEWVTALLLVSAAALYGVGWWRWQQRRAGAGPLRHRELALYMAGIAAAAGSLLGPLDALAEIRLWAHIVQHMLLLAIVPPLLLLGRPALALTGLAAPSARQLVSAGGHVRRRALAQSLLATACCSAVIWVWHAPAALQRAATDEAAHWLMHLSFLAAGTWFWAVQLAAWKRHVAPWPALAGLLLITMQMGFIGALLSFAPRVLVPIATRGGDPLADQQLAGLLMWVPFCLPYLAMATLLGARQAGRLAPAAAHHQETTEVDS
jgi:putative membrane protein